jgi:chemotaxis protein methyltransferase CheR
MLTDRQFDRTRHLALSLAGIELCERHREVLDHRSRRLGVVGGAGLDELLDAAEKRDAKATQQLINLLTTKFSSFFRHPRHFEIAARHALAAAQQSGRARLWSAAAATGEEPYSLAMALLEIFRSYEPPARILATDVDVDALAVARRGEYREAALQPLQPERRERFLSPSGIAGFWSIAPAVRRLVDFQGLNLTDMSWPVEGQFDVILCRNVLMYLEACHRYAVAERLASLLAPGGVLFLDPAEHLGKAEHLFNAGTSGVYSPRRAAGPRSRVTRLCP